MEDGEPQNFDPLEVGEKESRTWVIQMVRRPPHTAQCLMEPMGANDGGVGAVRGKDSCCFFLPVQLKCMFSLWKIEEVIVFLPES